jgi:hypothetical protein
MMLRRLLRRSRSYWHMRFSTYELPG